MTYRSDSDIPQPYGKIQRRLLKQRNPEEQCNKLQSNRSKLVAWTVSNCSPKLDRNKVAEGLANLLPVDVYGRCGQYQCPWKKTFLTHVCQKHQEKMYKFYLAFENSLCEEYVTEKFFNTLKSDMVPVVYGLGDYASIAPPKSFINVRDFKTIKELADYLLWLDRNPKEYAKYFEWKEYFEVIEFARLNIWCDVCEKVTKERDTGWPEKKTWGDLRAWFLTKIPKKGVSNESEADGFSNNGFIRSEPACI